MRECHGNNELESKEKSDLTQKLTREKEHKNKS